MAIPGILVAVGVVSLAVPAAAADSPAPPMAVRSQIEDHAVVIRVSDRNVDQQLQAGTGLIIGSTETTALILTARHVVRPADWVAARLQIEVRPSWGRDWTLAGDVVHESLPSDDYAVVEVPLDRLRPDGRHFKLSVGVLDLDAANSRAPVWALGYDIAKDRLEWIQGVSRSAEGGGVVFDAVGLREGYSGGPLASTSGAAALVLAMGSADREHRAIDLDKVLKGLDGKRLALSVEQSPIPPALKNLKERKLTGALFIWRDEDRNSTGFWTALRITSGDGWAFEGDILGTRAGGPCSLKWTGSTLHLTVPKLGWDRVDNLGADAAAITEFVPDAVLSIKDFVVLRSQKGNVSAFLALPQGSTEFVATRMIANGASTTWSSCDLRGEPLRVWGRRSDMQIRSRLEPFAVCVKHIRNPRSDLNLGITDLALPRQLGIREVEIRGKFAVPDGTKERITRARDWDPGSLGLEFAPLPAKSSPQRIGGLFEESPVTVFSTRLPKLPDSIAVAFCGGTRGQFDFQILDWTVSYIDAR